MAFPSLSGLIQVGVDILKSTVSPKTKAIVVQTGDAVAQDSEADNVEWWQHVGLISRPPKPQTGKQACQGIVVRRGDHDACVASRDLRGLELAGQLSDGETCLYGPGEDGDAQGRVIIKKNGNVVMFTVKGNTPTGTSVTIQCNADGTIFLASEYGGISITSDGIKAVDAGGGGFQLSGGKAALLGSELALNGSNVSIGGPGGTGVATQASLATQNALMVAFMGTFAAFATTFNTFAQACTGPSPAEKNAVTAALNLTNASAILVAGNQMLPTNYSQTVKASFP